MAMERALCRAAPVRRPAAPSRPPRRRKRTAVRYCPAPQMDLLEYQGKELFARHGLRVSSGKAVTDVEAAAAAAAQVGYPVVVKAQVLIGGRGKAGGVKIAPAQAELRQPGRDNPRMG